MAHIVCEPCVGCKYTDCVEVCPVNCFYEVDDRLYIHPDECIDCTACVPVCPVEAIFTESDVPEKWKPFIAENRDKLAGAANITARKSHSGRTNQSASRVRANPSRHRGLSRNSRTG